MRRTSRIQLVACAVESSSQRQQHLRRGACGGGIVMNLNRKSEARAAHGTGTLLRLRLNTGAEGSKPHSCVVNEDVRSHRRLTRTRKHIVCGSNAKFLCATAACRYQHCSRHDHTDTGVHGDSSKAYLRIPALLTVLTRAIDHPHSQLLLLSGAHLTNHSASGTQHVLCNAVQHH